MLDNATAQELQNASYAWCDHIGISRQSGYEREGALALATRAIPYPADLPAMVGQAEVLRSDGALATIQRRIEPGEQANRTKSVIFSSTVDSPTTVLATAQTPETIVGGVETVQAGSFTCDVPAPTPEDANAVQSTTVHRGRLPRDATNVVWTEGPYAVPARVVAGRDPMAAIIASGEGGL